MTLPRHQFLLPYANDCWRYFDWLFLLIWLQPHACRVFRLRFRHNIYILLVLPVRGLFPAHVDI